MESNFDQTETLTSFGKRTRSFNNRLILKHQLVASKCVESLIDDIPFATPSEKTYLACAKLLKDMGAEKTFDTAIVLGRLMQARLEREDTKQITPSAFIKSTALLSRTGLYSAEEILSAIPVLTRVWTYSDELKKILSDTFNLSATSKSYFNKRTKVPAFIEVISKNSHHSM